MTFEVSISNLCESVSADHSGSSSMSSSSSIHGHLEVTVVGCTNLINTELISRRDPYVCLEYGGTKYRTRTCIDGGMNPEFLDEFVFKLVEGHVELHVVVWNSNRTSTTHDDFIGRGKFQLEKLFSQGYDVSAWPLQTETGRHAGEVILELYQVNAANEQAASGHASKKLTKSPVPPYYYSAPSSSHPPPPAYAASYPPPAAWPVSYPPPTAWPAFYPPHATPYPPPPYPPTATYPPPPPPYTQYHQGNNHGSSRRSSRQSLLHAASFLLHALDICQYL